MNKITHVKQPRRILVLGETSRHTEHVTKVLTRADGRASKTAAPEAEPEIPVHLIETPYYIASVPVWRDEIPSPEAWASQWRSEQGASDVVRAIGAWVVCFTKPIDSSGKESLKNMLSILSRTIHHHLNSASSAFALDYLDISDIVTLAIAIPSPDHQISNSDPATASDLSTVQSEEAEAELEELCQTATGMIGTGLGWEYVDGTIPAASGRLNEFGERIGLDRLIEALRGGEWDTGAMDDESELEPEGDGGMDENFGFEKLDDDEEDGDGQNDGGDGFANEEGFGNFETALPRQSGKNPKDGGLALEDDDFTNEMAAGFGEMLAAGRSSRHPFDTDDEPQLELDQTQDRARELGEEMKKSLLSNAQGIGTADGSQGVDSRSTSKGHDAGEDSEDPWRVRGKGPTGPAAQQAKNSDMDLSAGFPTDPDDGDEVELLQSMMLKLQAARDLGADLPPAQRRQMAARAVREVMREI